MLIYISDLLSLDGDLDIKGLESDSMQSSSCNFYFREAEVSFQTSLKYRIEFSLPLTSFILTPHWSNKG